MPASCEPVSHVNSYLGIFFAGQCFSRWSRKAPKFLIWISCASLLTRKLRWRASCFSPGPNWRFSHCSPQLLETGKPSRFLYLQTFPSLGTVTWFLWRSSRSLCTLVSADNRALSFSRANSCTISSSVVSLCLSLTYSCWPRRLPPSHSHCSSCPPLRPALWCRSPRFSCACSSSSGACCARQPSWHL